MAFPRETLTQTDLTARFEAIQKIVIEEKVQLIVIGLPLTLKGERGPAAQKVLKFGAALAQTVSCPITYEDERYSSQTADEYLSKNSQKGDRDAVAAAIILESFLQESNHDIIIP